MDDPAPFELTFEASSAGDRLDRALAGRLSDHSRATVQRWIDAGRVTVDGRAVSSKEKVRAGTRVRVAPMAAPTSDALPEDLPLTILHEDEHLVVVDKAAGMVVHPAPGHPSGTLVNALLHRFGPTLQDAGEAAGDDDDEDQSAPSYPRPGIVHRLDRDTSGVMVIARTRAAREALMARFAAHDLERIYLALVEGLAPVRATYDTLHGRHPVDRKKLTGKVTRGKRAVTHVERVEVLAGASLVRCRLETGRTHQIRVHLSEHGLPLLGDPVYGRASSDPSLRALGAALGRQALHAAVLGFDHPVTGRRLRFETPLPADFDAALRALRAR